MWSPAPLVSIIIPAYRCGRTLPRTLESLLAQTESRWEAIVVDDGSPEPVTDIVAPFSRADARFHVVLQANAGASAARNTGLAQARAWYVLLLDADDWLEPTALEVLTRACQEHGWGAAHGLIRYVTADGAPTERVGGYWHERPLFEALAESNVLAVPSCVLVRRKLVQQLGGLDTTLENCGDWDLWARIARSHAPTGHVPEVVTNYRMQPASLCRDPRRLLRSATETLSRIHRPDPRVPYPREEYAAGADRSKLAERVSHFTLYAAGSAFACGDLAGAIDLVESCHRWPELCPARAAEFIFYAVCFARCLGPEDAAAFWPALAPELAALLEQVEQRADTPGLARAVLEQTEALRAGRRWRAAPQAVAVAEVPAEDVAERGAAGAAEAQQVPS